MNQNYINGDQFHSTIKKVYEGEINQKAINKKDENMALVVYEPIHENNDFADIRKGNGKGYSKWVFAEEKGIEENIFTSNLELMIDTRLEPNAAIGLHKHTITEEVYYILEGSITMTTLNEDNSEFTETLNKGDAHVIKVSQSHYGQAGNQGVRFLTVAVKV